MQTGGDIAIVTLGCAKNEVDSDKIAARLIQKGYRIVDDPLDAALVIVNTCSFLVSAVDEGLDVIFDLLEAQEATGKAGRLIVAGCMPSRYKDELACELPEVAAFVAVDEEADIAAKVASLIGATPLSAHQDAPLRRARTRASAYVKISDGCNRCCSFCMIPRIRGHYRSSTQDEILAEVAELVDRGVREIVFIGQDSGVWGCDLPGSPRLAELVKTACTRFRDTWFRLLYLQPEGTSDELLELMASRENVCSYLDIPMQHCSRRVLRRMRRSGDGASYLALIAHAREVVPDIMIRTTLMAGFPGETEAEFCELCDFVDEAQFDYAVVFAYSAEEGSPAACFDGQVNEEVKRERAQRLLDTCETIGHRRMARHVGRRIRVLCDDIEQTQLGLEALCRWQGQAPDVDGLVHVPLARAASNISVGDFADVEIVDSFCYDLEGSLL